MTIEFHKYQGTGNDFILIDNRETGCLLSNEQVKFLCNRHFGIGADGLMLLENEVSFDFKMIYFNSDGHLSSMCGNGGRCITAFAKQLGIIKEKTRFFAVDGAHDAVISGGQISLKMNDVKNVEVGADYYFLNTGSPHHVKIVNDVNKMDVVEEGKKIRYSEKYRVEGTNVNFIEKLEDAIFVRTYERGVENETLSCGTGVTAAALVSAIKGFNQEKNSCRVLTRGGELQVTYERVLDHTFYNIWLEGSAEFVYKGSINI